MKRSDKITLVFMFVAVFGVGFCAWYVRSHTQEAVPYANLSESERTFINTQYQTVSGAPVSLANYAGDVLVVNAWASWCPACAGELSDLATLAGLYADRDVAVIAINRAEPVKTVVAYLASIGLPSTQAPHIWLDQPDAFYKGIGGVTMSETVIYSRDGTVSAHVRGPMKLTQMQQSVNEALRK